MTLFEAVFGRQSIRKYKKEYLSQDFFRAFRKFELTLLPYDKSLKYSIEMYNAMDKEVKAKGLFLVKAPYYLVIYSEPGENAGTNAGYLMEQIVLYMTTKGVGTCYQGAAKITDAPDPEGMEPQMVLAFGIPEGKLTRDQEKAKRLPFKDLCVFKEPSTEETRLMMQAARLAPSSVNSQPWRFVIYQNRIHVFIRKGFFHLPDTPFKKLPVDKMKKKADFPDLTSFDLGIMLCHISLAAEECWRDVEFEVDEEYSMKELKNNDYFVTVKLV